MTELITHLLEKRAFDLCWIDFVLLAVVVRLLIDPLLREAGK